MSALVLASACGRDAAGNATPSWQRLWLGHDPAPFLLAERTWSGSAAQGFAVRMDDTGDGVWFDYRLDEASWTATEWPRVWRAPRPTGKGIMRAQENAAALSGAEVTYRQAAGLGALGDVAQLAAGEFTVFGSSVFAHSGTAPAEALTLSVHRRRTRGGKPLVGGVTGPGFAVWPGQREHVTLRGPLERLDRTLRFATVTQGMGVSAAAPVTFRVVLAGEPVWEAKQAVGEEPRTVWRSVILPARSPASEPGDGGEELAFEVRGPPAITAFVAPVLGPREVGVFDERPWPATRPDLVLFLADTLRADSLAIHGGSPDLTPHLNRFADASVRFRRAWSPCSWTLPAQASMLTGLFPEQHGAVSGAKAIPEELTTIAEHLAAHGYRTGAVTDSAFVSANYGFDQGFEWFHEQKAWDLRETLARATEFLDADDGRPVFLFVHTYRTHSPYRTGPAESREELRRLRQDLGRLCTEYGGNGEMSIEEAAVAVRAIYDEGVRALDELFGGWLAELEQRRFLERGHLLFTSDHGEVFGKHGRFGHGGPFLWESMTRVPLLVGGGDLDPRDILESASLVDVPATVAALAGVPPADSWTGSDALNLSSDRPAYAFIRDSEGIRSGDGGSVAVVSGVRKVGGPVDFELGVPVRLDWAGALDEDPDEIRNRKDEVDWAAELWRLHRAEIQRLMVPVAKVRPVQLEADERAQLAAIGYGGELDE